MASLLELTPCDGLLPLHIGDLTLTELPWARITSVAPLVGTDRAMAAALKEMGLGWPAPGRAFARDGSACLWSGRGQAMLIGAEPNGLSNIAALTDQSDGWARIRLDGAGAETVLARLVPLDLSQGSFGKGQVARTSMGHMMMLVTRTGVAAFDMMVFRSMARTAIHELEQAMKAVAARGAVFVS